MAASATLALKPGVWFRRGRLLIVSPDSLGTACPLSGRNSTYRLVQILEAGSIFAFFASQSAQGQVTVDVTKINCDQFVHHKISEPSLIAAWLSGYYNAKRNNRVIDLQMLDDNMSKVKNYCSDEKNFKVPVMKAVENVLGKSK